MIFNKISQKILSILKEDKDILFVYLFGSQVKGKSDFESDVDFAVYLDEKRVNDFFKKRLFLIEKFQEILKKHTEVVILNEIKSIFFKFVIIKEGKVILERDHEKRIDFEFKTMQEFYDFQPFLKEYNRVYLERELDKI